MDSTPSSSPNVRVVERTLQTLDVSTSIKLLSHKQLMHKLRQLSLVISKQDLAIVVHIMMILKKS